jgi:hypothetical protein
MDSGRKILHQNRKEVLVDNQSWTGVQTVIFRTDALPNIGEINFWVVTNFKDYIYRDSGTQKKNKKNNTVEWSLELDLAKLLNQKITPGTQYVYLFSYPEGDISSPTYQLNKSLLEQNVPGFKNNRIDNVDIEAKLFDSLSSGYGSFIIRLRIDSTVDSPITEGKSASLSASLQNPSNKFDIGNVEFDWKADSGKCDIGSDTKSATWHSDGVSPGLHSVHVTAKLRDSGDVIGADNVDITVEPRPLSRDDTIAVTMRRTATQKTKDQALWMMVRNSTKAISFSSYKDFTDAVMCDNESDNKLRGHKEYKGASSKGTPFPFIDAYRRLKVASEVFLMTHCGVKYADHEFDQYEESARLGYAVNKGDFDRLWNDYLEPLQDGDKKTVLPYLNLVRHKLDEYPIKQDGVDATNVTNCYGILQTKLSNPCLLELIWSYWHEESMLAQAMNMISLRFQNRKGLGERDPLANMDIDPLRPLGNLLWGYIQDQQHRLSVVRRAYEYDHQYGLTLLGKAVPSLRSADSRSKFLEGLHNLLHVCAGFYERDDDTTVIADGFPVLNALKEVHMLLAQGAHNQFGDLPSTARMEMLMDMWILARPEMREFLNSRIMIPYEEPWMDRLDVMKKLQGWTDVSVTNFHKLAVFGEQLLLSIRYGNWIEVDDQTQAANWARYWRPEVQGYLHNYRSVTGVDLNMEPVNSVLPGLHLQKRLAMQGARM